MKGRCSVKAFAIVNLKGGVGKTATAVNPTYVLATGCRLRVLLAGKEGIRHGDD